MAGEAIQRKTFWNAAAIETRNMMSAGASPPDEAALLTEVLSAHDDALRAEVLQKTAIAVAALARDPAVDVTVARDLGRADGYPARSARLPAHTGSTRDEFFAEAYGRVVLFWRHITGFPLHPALAALSPDAPAAPAGAAPPAAQAPDGTDADILSILRQLCVAYAENDTATIARLEPVATRIGEDLHNRGGLSEMRRVWVQLGNIRGSRTLDMHWHGIGDWRG